MAGGKGILPMEERLDSEKLIPKRRGFEKVQQLAWCDIVTRGQQSNGESHHRKNTKRYRPKEQAGFQKTKSTVEKNGGKRIQAREVESGAQCKTGLVGETK